MHLATEARQFLRSTRHGVLSTHSNKFSGYPFGSVTPFVLDHSCQPVILISSIAEHTKNIISNPKVSLLIFAEGADLQANARLTLIGEATRIDKNDADLRARYLRYFLPQAAGYFETHDFAFYRINIHQARYIAGFGKMGWASGAEMITANNAIAALENGMIDHMNADHVDSMIAYCRHFYNVNVDTAQLIGIDSDGFDLLAKVDGQTQTFRFNFEQPISDAQTARAAFVAMSKVTRV